NNRTARNAISALDVVGQHVTGQGKQAFGRYVWVAVVKRLRYVVDDVNVDTTGGHIPIVIGRYHWKMVDYVVSAIAGSMGLRTI
ncbi:MULTISPECIES: hypothetical protein, partial [unclassified Pseudomonas]|uniref:hypothetical protein n=1 Tax=unclassified Pseudomonas TaxID=196821 RepID=UPI002B2338E5